MTYVVEAVDLDADGKPTRLRWHSVADDEKATRGAAAVVSIDEALVQSAGEPVYLSSGDVAAAPLMRMRVDDKETFVDAPDAAPGQRLADMPKVGN